MKTRVPRPAEIEVFGQPAPKVVELPPGDPPNPLPKRPRAPRARWWTPITTWAHRHPWKMFVLGFIACLTLVAIRSEMNQPDPESLYGTALRVHGELKRQHALYTLPGGKRIDWLLAGEENQIATCIDFADDYSAPEETIEEVCRRAVQLVEQIDEHFLDDSKPDISVRELMLMYSEDWRGDE